MIESGKGRQGEGEGTEFAGVLVIGALITENNQLYNTSRELPGNDENSGSGIIL